MPTWSAFASPSVLTPRFLLGFVLASADEAVTVNNLLNETTISSFNIEVGFNAIVLSFFECNANSANQLSGARGFRMKAEIE
jgi:hypothetical protein